MGTQTAVDAPGERQVGSAGTVEIDLFGVFEHIRVVVGGRQQAGNAVTGAHLYAVELIVPSECSTGECHGEYSQQFLDYRIHIVESLTHFGPPGRILCQPYKDVVEGGKDRIQAGYKEEESVAEYLRTCHRNTVDLAVDNPADHTLVRIPGFFPDDFVEIGADRAHTFHSGPVPRSDRSGRWSACGSCPPVGPSPPG